VRQRDSQHFAPLPALQHPPGLRAQRTQRTQGALTCPSQPQINSHVTQSQQAGDNAAPVSWRADEQRR
jgi:hypothetical protein